MPTFETLPLEVRYHILSYLDAPQLLEFRTVSKAYGKRIPHMPEWKLCFERLVLSHPALLDLELFPTSSWSFSRFEWGWMRACIVLLRVARTPWMRPNHNPNLDDSRWNVLIKQQIIPDVNRQSHAIVLFPANERSRPLEGLALNSMLWTYGDVGVLFPGYPALMPRRHPLNWARILEHATILCLSIAPEFFQAIYRLNDSMIQRDASLSADEKKRLCELASTTRESIEEEMEVFLHDRLKSLYQVSPQASNISNHNQNNDDDDDEDDDDDDDTMSYGYEDDEDASGDDEEGDENFYQVRQNALQVLHNNLT